MANSRVVVIMGLVLLAVFMMENTQLRLVMEEAVLTETLELLSGKHVEIKPNN